MLVVCLSGNLSLKYLDISKNNFKFDRAQHAEDDPLANQLKFVMANGKSNLLSINMSDCNVCDVGLEFLFGYLLNPIKLTEINFHNNSVTDKGFSFILRAMEKNIFRPKSMCFSSNFIKDVSLIKLV